MKGQWFLLSLSLHAFFYLILKSSSLISPELKPSNEKYFSVSVVNSENNHKIEKSQRPVTQHSSVEETPSLPHSSLTTANQAQVNGNSLPAPTYPEFARSKGWEGKVEITVTTDQEGRVIEAQIEKSSGYRILDQAALDATKQWELAPRQKTKIPVEFRLKPKTSESP